MILKRLNDKIKIYKDKHKKQILLPNPKSEDPDTLIWDLSDPTQRKSFLSVRDNLWIEGYAVSKNSGDTGLQLTYRPIKPLSGGVLQDIIDTMKCTVVKVEILNPKDLNGDGIINDQNISLDLTGNEEDWNIYIETNDPKYRGNEFSYDGSNPGILEIYVQVRILPDVEEIRNIFRNKIKVILGSIGDSHSNKKEVKLVWENAEKGDSNIGVCLYDKNRYEVTCWGAKATFIGLPSKNEEFGKKSGEIKIENPYGNSLWYKEKFVYEVFFNKYAMNHPEDPRIDNCENGIIEGDYTVIRKKCKTVNWYFYWKKSNLIPELKNTNFATYDSKDFLGVIIQGIHDKGKIYLTKYAAGKNKKIKVKNTLTADPPLEIGSENVGINAVISVFYHEKKHKELYYELQKENKDKDNDILCDCHECDINEMLKNQNLLEGDKKYHLFIGAKDTYNLSKINSAYSAFGDNEFLARKAETFDIEKRKILNKKGDWSASILGENWRK